MSAIGNHVVGLYQLPAYLAGRQALVEGKHLIPPIDLVGNDREAWVLGWNEEWSDQNDRSPS